MASLDRPRADAPPIRPSIVPTELVPERRGALAFLSSFEREGDWLLPRAFRAVACFGNVELDLTAARVGAGVSEIEVVAVMGNVTLTVPPELRVECEGDPIMGSFEVKRDAPTTATADAPLLKIRGTAVMGSVTIRVVDPNAPGWLARLRATLSGAR